MKEKILVIRLADNGYIVTDTNEVDKETISVFSTIVGLTEFIAAWDNVNKGKK